MKCSMYNFHLLLAKEVEETKTKKAWTSIFVLLTEKL